MPNFQAEHTMQYIFNDQLQHKCHAHGAEHSHNSRGLTINEVPPYYFRIAEAAGLQETDQLFLTIDDDRDGGKNNNSADYQKNDHEHGRQLPQNIHDLAKGHKTLMVHPRRDYRPFTDLLHFIHNGRLHRSSICKILIRKQGALCRSIYQNSWKNIISEKLPEGGLRCENIHRFTLIVGLGMPNDPRHLKSKRDAAGHFNLHLISERNAEPLHHVCCHGTFRILGRQTAIHKLRHRNPLRQRQHFRPMGLPAHM